MTVHTTRTAETSLLAKARSCTTSLMLAPLAANLARQIYRTARPVADDRSEPAQTSISNQSPFDHPNRGIRRWPMVWQFPR